MPVHIGEEAVPEVTEASAEEGAAVLDSAARRHLGISGPEFLVAWDSGALGDLEQRPMFNHVAMLIPFAR